MRLKAIGSVETGLVASIPILALTPSRDDGSSLDPCAPETITRWRSAWKRVATAFSISLGGVDIDVHVDNDYLLDVIVSPKRARDPAVTRSVAWVTNPGRVVSAAMAAVMEIIAGDLTTAAASASRLVRR
jgi:hypothetical protein